VLTPGSRVGPYEIVALVGAGGMGEVYRARDPRLGRDVAIKILPLAISGDVARLRRFADKKLLTPPPTTPATHSGCEPPQPNSNSTD
jgi:serine/threonine protein kinase